ncbi:MAG: helix-turn-helix domain-containing protein [Chloroflexota bacterium]|nr:helix-turn-helix domain-containing protein [Chloroflexota bacterium]
MNFLPTGRLLRMLRIRRGWRQDDVGPKCGLSAAAISRHELGSIGSWSALEKHAAVFSLRLDVRLLGRAGALVRLGDEEHAAIVEVIASSYRNAGFDTETEGSFSEWGERGRIDLLAFETSTGNLVIVEVKTQLLDLQDLFGSLNVKERLAASVAERRGWKVRRQTALLAAADTSANREIVRAHPTLFADFVRRRLSAAALDANPRHILTWVSHEQASRGAWVAGRQRVRRASRSQALDGAPSISAE